MNKIKIIDPHFWKHHRCGWKYVMYNLMQFHTNNGVLLEGALDRFLLYNKNNQIKEEWIGFLHNPPTHPKHSVSQDAGKIIQSKEFEKNKSLCRGLFVLSEHLKIFLENITDISICAIKHPTEFVNINFDFESFIENIDKNIIIIGTWLRRYNTFFAMKSPYQKQILNNGISIKNEFEKQKVQDNNSVKILPTLSDQSYDNFLSKNLVFLDLYDSSANNAIIECIVRNTPILINKIPPVVEYLGQEYPFYFESLEEANDKINNLSLIEKTYLYLKNMDKSDLQIENFLFNFENSQIYKKLHTSKKVFL